MKINKWLQPQHKGYIFHRKVLFSLTVNKNNKNFGKNKFFKTVEICIN